MCLLNLHNRIHQPSIRSDRLLKPIQIYVTHVSSAHNTVLACYHIRQNSINEGYMTSEVFDLKPTSGNPGNPGIRIEFVGWRPFRNCSTAMSLSKWSVSTVCT